MQEAVEYSQAIVRKYPEQVVIAIAKDPQGKYNPITLGWIMPTSNQPPMFAISVAFARHSYEAIRGAREFVISYPSVDMAKDALFHGTKSGRDMDKLAECGTAVQPASKIDCVLLSEAVANFECVLDGELESGDHAIFSGRVVQAHIHTKPDIRRLYTLGPGYDMGGVLRG